MTLEFVANGSPTEVAVAIEQYALAQGHVNAIVVPWESSQTMLSMAVTSVKADGWAIEHTNLGTITLTDRGDSSTAVTVTPQTAGRDDQARLASLFERFAEQLQQRFKA